MQRDNKVLYIISIIITVIIAVFIVFAMYTIHINNVLAQLLKNKDSLLFKYDLNLLVLSDKNVDAINNTKDFRVLKNGIEFSVNNVDNINWFNIYNVNTKYYSFKSHKIILKEDVLDGQIKIQLPDFLKNNTKVDVYVKTNDKYEIYAKSIKVENNNIIINTKKGIQEYLITYIPLLDIKLEKENIDINRTQTVEIGYEIYPSNATETEIIFTTLEDFVSIDKNKITANKTGKTKILLASGNVTKEIDVQVNEIVSEIILDKKDIILKVGESINIIATPKPDNAANKELVWESSNQDIVSVDGGLVTLNKSGYAIVTVSTKQDPKFSKEIIVSSYKIYKEPEKYNKQGITYIDGILVVNKKYSLPKDFNPGLNQLVVNAYNDMKNAAKKDGVNMQIVSDFRSYSTQKYLYNSYVSKYGVAYASRMSAKAGESEHQTGLALDISMLHQNFGNTYEGRWLAKNCAKYGFIIRYPMGKESITGYMYEPWHVRYVGTILAEKITASGLCLEEYLNID